MTAINKEEDVPFVNNNNVIRRNIIEGLYCKDHYTPEKWCDLHNQLFPLPKNKSCMKPWLSQLLVCTVLCTPD